MYCLPTTIIFPCPSLSLPKDKQQQLLSLSRDRSTFSISIIKRNFFILSLFFCCLFSLPSFRNRKKISHQSEFCLKFFLLKEIDFLFPKNKNRPKVLIYLFIFKTNKRLSLVCVFLHIFKSYLEQIFFLSLSACFLPNTMGKKNTLSFWVFNI